MVCEKPTRVPPWIATVMKVEFAERMLTKASVEKASRTSVATSFVIPAKAYVSKNTWVARTPKHKASAAVASRREISIFLVFTVAAWCRCALRPNV